MLVRGVVDDQVHDQFHPKGVNVCDELIEVVHGPESGIDVLIIGNVVAIIGLGRAVDRREPQNINAQFLQVSQPGADPLEIAETISVRVVK